MAYCVDYGDLYNNGTTKELKVNNGDVFKIYAVGTGGSMSYQVVGKLESNATATPLAMYKYSSPNTTPSSTITDGGIYEIDVAGFYSVSVQNVSGCTKIYGTIVEV